MTDVRVTVETPDSRVTVRVQPRKRKRRMSREARVRWREYLDRFSLEVRWSEATDTDR